MLALVDTVQRRVRLVQGRTWAVPLSIGAACFTLGEVGAARSDTAPPVIPTDVRTCAEARHLLSVHLIACTPATPAAIGTAHPAAHVEAMTLVLQTEPSWIAGGRGASLWWFGVVTLAMGTASLVQLLGRHHAARRRVLGPNLLAWTAGTATVAVGAAAGVLREGWLLAALLTALATWAVACDDRHSAAIVVVTAMAVTVLFGLALVPRWVAAAVPQSTASVTALGLACLVAAALMWARGAYAARLAHVLAPRRLRPGAPRPLVDRP